MIRISGGRCGYSGYICSGIPELSRGYFIGTSGGKLDFNCDWHSGGIVGGAYSHNNYQTLPQQAAGMCMTVAYIPVFSGGVLNYPESSCPGKTNTVDPFPDIYSLVVSGGMLYSSDKLYAANSLNSYDSDTRVDISYSLPCFADNGTELHPGMLEPMLTVSMPAITTQFNTGIDSVLDGVMITIKALNVWRTYVDNSIKTLATTNVFNTKIKIKDLNPVTEATDENPCGQFKIHMTRGSLITCGNAQKPRFGVTSGAIILNGTDTPTEVAEYTPDSDQTFPLNFYLDIDRENEIVEITTDNTPIENHTIYHIGGVTATSGKELNNCTVYHIWQAQCEFNDVQYEDNNDEDEKKAFIGVVVTSPANGYGTGAVRHISIDGTGAYKTTTGSISVVFPYIG